MKIYCFYKKMKYYKNCVEDLKNLLQASREEAADNFQCGLNAAAFNSTKLDSLEELELYKKENEVLKFEIEILERNIRVLKDAGN